MNVIDALLQDDALHGQHLDDNGLAKIRVQIKKMHEIKDDEGVRERNELVTEVPSLFNGEILQQSDDIGSPFGLREAPLG